MARLITRPKRSDVDEDEVEIVCGCTVSKQSDTRSFWRR